MQSGKFLATLLVEKGMVGNMHSAKFNVDLEQFQDFQKQCSEATLRKDHPVLVILKKCANTVAYKYGQPDMAEDLAQAAMPSLLKANYRGESSLKRYLIVTLERLNIANWHASGEGLEKEILGEEVIPDRFEEVLRHIHSDRLIKELMQSRPELQRIIVEILLEHGKHIGSRLLAREANKMLKRREANMLLKRKVTRYQVEVALEQLKLYLARHIGRSRSERR